MGFKELKSENGVQIIKVRKWDPNKFEELLSEYEFQIITVRVYMTFKK